MNRIKIYNSLLIAVLAVLVMACNDTDSFHDKYLAGGEKIYSKKVDSLYTRAGNERIELVAFIGNAFNVKTIEVQWEDGKQKKSFDYVKVNEIDTVSLMIDGLTEGAYEFEVYPKDKDGNVAVKTIAFASAYGEGFRKYLTTRSTDGFSYDGTNAKMTMSVAAESDRGTEIKFTNTSNEEITVVVPQDSTTAELENFSPSATIKCRTLHVPESSAIDSFPSDWKEVTLPPLMDVLNSVTIAPEMGGAKLAWTNPSETDIKVTVKFMGSDGIEKTSTYETSSASDELSISRVMKGEQDIKVTIEDLIGNAFGPVVKKVTPTLPDLSAIVSSIAVTPVLGGVKVTWTNAGSDEIKIKTVYTGSDDSEKTNEESTSASGEVVISGMKSGAQDVKVTVVGKYGNEHGTKTVNTSPGEAVKIDKSGWSVVDFSSEEASGEGPSNGRASDAIDNDESTFWHAQWQGGTATVPHHLTFDIGKEVTISSFEVKGRDSRGHTKQKFYVSTDNTNWIEVNETSFDPSNSAAQMFATPSNPVARYFKLELLEDGGASAIKEISLYGLE